MATKKKKKEKIQPSAAGSGAERELPPLLHSRVYADFRDESAYFITAFDLILDLYDIPHQDPAVADLRESLEGPEMR